jgi:hypothetical protein
LVTIAFYTGSLKLTNFKIMSGRLMDLLIDGKLRAEWCGERNYQIDIRWIGDSRASPLLSPPPHPRPPSSSSTPQTIFYLCIPKNDLANKYFQNRIMTFCLELCIFCREVQNYCRCSHSAVSIGNNVLLTKLM